MPNKNIVNYEKLKEILQALWNRIKDKFIEDVTFDIGIDNATNKPKNTLKKTQNGAETNVINHVVTEWKDLKDVYEVTHQNIFNPSVHVIKGSYYNRNNGSVTTDNSGTWGRTVIPFTRNTIYTVYKTKHISQTFVYLNASGNVVGVEPMNGTPMNGNTFTRRYKIDTNNAPHDAVAFGFNIVVDKNNNSYIDINRNVMVFAEELTQGFNDLIPKTDGAEIVIDGSQVSIGFDATGTNILANTVNDAIKFLEKNTVTSLDTKVDRAEVGNTGNLIPRLENGKLVDAIIPEIAITRIVDVVDKAEAVNQATSGAVQEGDFVRITTEQNKIYIKNNGVSGDFTDRFIEISLGDETVRTINTHKPELNGNFQFTLEETVDKVKLQVGRQDIAEVNFATTQEITELKDLLVFR